MNQGLSARSKLIIITAIIFSVCALSISCDKYHCYKIENNYKKVTDGMSRTDVFRLLGAPGEYGRYARGGSGMQHAILHIEPKVYGSRDVWNTDNMKLIVLCDSEDNVICHYRYSGYCQLPPNGVIEQILCAIRWVVRI